MSEIKIFQPSDITLEHVSKKNKPNSLITNQLGHISFGDFPANNHDFPEATIILRLGLIGYGYGRLGAFGLRHIWEKHRIDLGITNPSEVVNFIESIIQPGAEVLIDKKKSPNKPLIIESSNGLISLNLTNIGDQPVYSIITAYDRKSHPGNVIATI